MKSIKLNTKQTGYMGDTGTGAGSANGNGAGGFFHGSGNANGWGQGDGVCDGKGHGNFSGENGLGVSYNSTRIIKHYEVEDYKK
jgi:hypothetical protein